MASIPDPSCDRISSLPGNIIETILLRLPIRDAVRTSILSRKWRYSWVTLPELVFDDTLCQESMENNSSAQTRLAFTIFKVLLLHRGPVLKFTLSISGLESCSEIDQSILFLSRNGVEEFTLKLWKGERYKLPSSLFSWIQLRHLSLRFCVFKPPPKFEGFIRLKSLELSEFAIARETVEGLISTCLLLEKLMLRRSATVFDDLEINAPNLKYLSAWDVTKSICFQNVPFLAEVSIGAADHPPEVLYGAGTCNLINLFASLPVIENLHMNYYFVKFCAVGGVPKRLSTTVVNLKVLFLSTICFSELDEVSFTLCLIRSSPNLQKITINVFVDIDPVTGPVVEFMEEQHYSDIVLEKLQEVKMENVSGTRPELEFIKFLLAKSPVLEKMLIKPKTMKADEGLKMLLETIRFRRLSVNAEIICKDPVGNQVQ